MREAVLARLDSVVNGIRNLERTGVYEESEKFEQRQLLRS